MAWLPATAPDPANIMVGVSQLSVDSMPATAAGLVRITGDSVLLVDFTAAGAVRASGPVTWQSDDGLIVPTTDGGGNPILGTARELRVWWSSELGEVRIGVYLAGASQPEADSEVLTLSSSPATLVERESIHVWSSTLTVTDENNFPAPPPVFRMYRHGAEVVFQRPDSGATIATVDGAAWDPGTSVEPGGDGTPFRVITNPNIQVPYALAGLVAAGDIAVIDGVTWQIDGQPKAYQNPFSGWRAGTVIGLEKVDG